MTSKLGISYRSTWWGSMLVSVVLHPLLLLMEEILHPLIGTWSHYLQGFIHPRWLFGISSINSIIHVSGTKALFLNTKHHSLPYSAFANPWKSLMPIEYSKSGHMPKHFFCKASFFIVSIRVTNIYYAWICLRWFFNLHLSPHWKINMSPENGPFQKESIVFQAAFFKRQLIVSGAKILW